MPLLDHIWAAYIGVVGTIIVGIITERKRVEYGNILGNLISLVLLLSTTEIWDRNQTAVVAMLLFSIFGVVIVRYKVVPLFPLFGNKTFGSIALVILLAEGRYFGLALDRSLYLLIGWLVVGAVVHAIGFAYARRGQRGGSGGRGRRGGFWGRRGRGGRKR